MNGFKERIDRAAEAFDRAEFVLIGGGAGLSDAAGLKYNADRFMRFFPDFNQNYGICDLYSAMFYPFPTEEEAWAYRARHILINRFAPDALGLYRALVRLVSEKDCFVVTTNVESQFEKAGVAAEKLFEAQGNYGLLQCAKGCHDTLYDDETIVRAMSERTADCKIPTELVPRCPMCGGAMAVHIRVDPYFVENADWRAANRRYREALTRAESGRAVCLELGVGFNTPTIIRFPFENAVRKNKNATLLRLNRDYPDGIPENAARTIPFTEDMNEVIGALSTLIVPENDDRTIRETGGNRLSPIAPGNAGSEVLP